ncbi:MAG: YjgN family protein [Firmicutes bacterium]|nr:YjgN family protein [Bacillota bacterium]MCL1953881.1 YjgN family protein [Bacillota bacterium]
MNEEEYGQKYQDALDKIESSDFESNSNTVYQTDTQQQDVVSQQSVEKYSKFDGNGIVYFFICVGCLMIQAVTLFLTRPWTVCLLQKYLATHTTIDGKQLYFDGTAAQLFGTWIKWILLTFITFGFYYFFSPFRMKKWVTKHTHAKVA